MSGSYLVWNQNSTARPNHHNLFVRHGTTITQINPPKTYGYNAGIDGTTVVYQQRSLAGQSDIRMYDVVTHVGLTERAAGPRLRPTG